MKKIFLSLFLLFISGAFAYAQKPGDIRTPTNRREVQDEIARERYEQQRRENQRTRSTIPINTALGGSRRKKVNHKTLIKNIYRNATTAELATIAPSREDFERFAGFLKQSDTGLLRLVPEIGCAENNKIISFRPECLKYSMPGGGSAYSFRTETYRIPGVADIFYTDNKFKGGDNLIEGIFVELGDVPLEQVDLQTDGVKSLRNFDAQENNKKLIETKRQLSNGIEKDGFRYFSSLPVNTNSTYVLRSIAYRGIVLRSVEGAAYNETDWDKRKDVIVAFRVVRKDADESVTILWKELSREDSPKITQ